MDALVLLVEGARALVAAPPRALAGVPVREVAALEPAVPSCFVGDLVGDCTQRSQHVSNWPQPDPRPLPRVYSAYPCNARRTRRPRNRTRARGVHAPPPPRAGVERVRGAPGAGSEATRPLFRGGRGAGTGAGPLFRRGLGDDGDGGGAHEHAVAHVAFEVALVLDAAIVLAGAVVQLTADPDARGEQGLADEADDGVAAVGEADDLPYCQV